MTFSLLCFIMGLHAGVSPNSYAEMVEWSITAVLKYSLNRHCKIVKTLDFAGLFRCCSARCEKRFSQFSRTFLTDFSHFWRVFEQFPSGFGNCSVQFNNLRRHTQVVEESGLENREDGSMPSRGFKSLCLRQRLGIQTNSKAFLIEKDLLFQKVFCVCLYLITICEYCTTDIDFYALG